MSVEIVSRVEEPSVTVNLTAGERLIYQVIVRGSTPTFTLEDSRAGKTLLNSEDEPTSQEPLTFSRRWPRQGDTIEVLTQHTMGMTFLAAVQYTYKADLLRPDGTKQPVIDMDFKSSSAEDDFFQNLAVSVI